MVSKKQRNKPSSKHPVQRFKASIEHKRSGRKRFIGNSEAGVLPNPLPKRALKILSVLAADGVAEQAMVAAECVKSNVSYWVKRFVDAGALSLRQTQIPNSTGPVGKIEEYKPGHPHYYDLTTYGSKLLTLGDGRLYFPILFEDRPLIFKVKARESIPIPWKRLGDVRHWRKSGIMLAGVRVELHEGLGPNHDGANVEIHPGHIKGFNVDELMMDSTRIVERVKFILESNYGLVLDEKGELPKSKTESSAPRWRVYVPAAREWVLHGSVDVLGVGAVDASPEPSKSGVKDPLSNVPHVEYNNPQDAALMALLYGSLGLTSDPAKRNTIDAVLVPTLLRAIFRNGTESLHQIELLSAEINKKETVCSQIISGVITELQQVAKTLSNLGQLPEIVTNLRKIVCYFDTLSAPSENSQAKIEGPKDTGGSKYVF